MEYLSVVPVLLLIDLAASEALGQDGIRCLIALIEALMT